jgi:hypothetical protein
MKKLILGSIIFFGLFFAWFGLSRKFICLDDNTCITVWKTFGNVCYLIPGKYYGIFSPTKDHIKTKNTALIELYFPELLPNTIIYRCTESVTIKNNTPEILVFKNFYSNDSTFQELLFDKTPQKKLNGGLNFIFIDIHNSYSSDKFRNVLW